MRFDVNRGPRAGADLAPGAAVQIEQDDSVERAVREARARGGARAASALLVEHYGPELLGFLAAMLRDEEAARDVFADVAEALLRDVDRFEERSSYRTWAYSVARHAALNARRRRPFVRLGADRMEAMVVVPRSETRPYLKTENKTRLARLRAALDAESQALLTLRIDRALSWEDIAQVLTDPPPNGPAAVRRAAARMRKRFERLKERLRAALLEADPPSASP